MTSGARFPQGITEFEGSESWTQEIPVIQDVVKACQTGMPGRESLEPLDRDGLNSRLRRGAPGLAALADQMLFRLRTDASALILRKLGLETTTLEEKHRILYALASLMGVPSPTDPRNRRAVWDVQARPTPPGSFATYGETSRMAPYHTDSQYSLQPERYFLLYVVTPASCGGGVTFLQNGTTLKERLLRSGEGRRTVRTLSQVPVPFYVPPVFSSSGLAEPREYTFAKVFGPATFLRWREDTLRLGLAGHPEFGTADVLAALDHLTAEINRPKEEFRAALPRDSLCLVDNHRILHGRTGFQDLQRHLIRIRFHDPRCGFRLA